MQKKLIALAVAAAFSAPAFADNANFTFYGKADVSYDIINTGTAASGTAGTSKRVVSSNVSKFGFKGAEDLGGGLAAVWQIEQQINIDDAAKNTFASRNTFAGLKGDFGTVLLGIHDTPYKLTTRKLDVFGDSIADNRALLGGVSGTSAAAAFDGRQSNVLAYVSPSMGGLTAAIAAVNLTEANKLDTDQSGSALSLGLMYGAAPFYAGFGYEKHSLDHVAVGASEKATKAGFGFKQDMFEVGAVVEKTSDNLAAAQENQYGHTAVYLSGKVNLGGGAIKLAYAKAGEIGSGTAKVANSGATMLSVGYDHKMSKQTKLYALYSKISNDDAAAYKFTQNSGASSTISGAGAAPSAISLGLQHNF